MVAKGFMAAAAIIICCATTLRGNDQETKSSGGDCPKACCDKEKCSAEKTACADGKCDDNEECCEKEQVSLEKCSKGKCSKEQVSLEKCSTEKCSTGKCSKKCSTGECAKSKCSAGTRDKEKCSTEKCSAEKCTAGKTCGEKCAFTTTLGGLCEPLRCALEATPVSIGVTVETCSKSECNASASEGETCPVAACASQVCDVLKCAVESCTTACNDDCGKKTVCATGACGTAQCATLECSNQDCPAGECNGGICVEGTSGLRCGLNASLTASGGEIVFKTEKWFPGTPVAEKCAKEVCTEKCKTSSVLEFMTAKCPQETCETSKCSTEPVATLNCTDSDCGTENGTAAGEELDAKLAEIRQLEREVAALRQQSGTPEQLSVNVKVVEVNVTKCRSLGFEFEFDAAAAASDLSDAIKISPDILVALEKRNLAKVCADPTLVVVSGRPARFHAGGEFPVSDATGRTQFKEFGTKVDVLATALGGRKVELDIRPEFSEVRGECGPAPCPALSARRWDSSCVTTLGTPLVLSSGSERRVVAKTITDNRQNPPQNKTIEEVEEVQFFAVVTVRGVGEQAESKTIRQAAYQDDASSEYERKLVAEVQDPEFITRVYPVPDLQVWKVRPQGVEFDADLLTAHVKATIAPHSWRGAIYTNPAQANRASGEIRPFERNGSLVVCQTEENHKKIADLFQKMRTDSLQKDAAREERELRDGSVTPASAEESVEAESKCSKGECGGEKCSESKGACSESKCNGSKCSKSQVGLESEPADQCPGGCQGKCNGECPETAECPCIGGACRR